MNHFLQIILTIATICFPSHKLNNIIKGAAIIPDLVVSNIYSEFNYPLSPTATVPYYIEVSTTSTTIIYGTLHISVLYGTRGNPSNYTVDGITYDLSDKYITCNISSSHKYTATLLLPPVGEQTGTTIKDIVVPTVTIEFINPSSIDDNPIITDSLYNYYNKNLNASEVFDGEYQMTKSTRGNSFGLDVPGIKSRHIHDTATGLNLALEEKFRITYNISNKTSLFFDISHLQIEMQSNGYNYAPIPVFLSMMILGVNLETDFNFSDNQPIIPLEISYLSSNKYQFEFTTNFELIDDNTVLGVESTEHTSLLPLPKKYLGTTLYVHIIVGHNMANNEYREFHAVLPIIVTMNYLENCNKTSALFCLNQSSFQTQINIPHINTSEYTIGG